MTDKIPADGRSTNQNRNTAPNNKPDDIAPEAKHANLPAAAVRALAEAVERRKQSQKDATPEDREIGGRGGADPARYGDWEINGRAIDF